MSTEKSWTKIAIRDSKKRGISRLKREYINVAVHEAAHAIVAAALGIHVTLVTMMPVGRPLDGGLTEYNNPLYGVTGDQKNLAVAKLATIAIAGAVGERLFRNGNVKFDARFFHTSGSESDMAEVFDLLDNDKKIAVDFAKYALNLIETNYDIMVNLADVLADEITLDEEQCTSLLAGVE